MEPLQNNADTAPKTWAGLGTRACTAVALGIVALGCVWLGGICFTMFALLAVLVMKKEWDALTRDQDVLPRALGYAYVILPCASLIWLRNVPEVGCLATIALIAIISATDIGAYFVGRQLGRHKLSPIISPNKTWEGLAGGVICAMAVALLFSLLSPLPHRHMGALCTGGLIALLAQGGDLFESYLKRKADVKDSGTLLPGHGGLLDRFDGYMFASPVFAALVYFAMF